MVRRAFLADPSPGSSAGAAICGLGGGGAGLGAAGGAEV